MGCIPTTKDSPSICSTERSQEMLDARPIVDWHCQNLQARILEANKKNTNASMSDLSLENFGVPELRALNQELMASGRCQSARCEISDLSHLDEALDIFYIDERGFMLAEDVLRECDVDMPFHPTIRDVLNLMNMSPVQLSSHGWRILVSFITKC